MTLPIKKVYIDAVKQFNIPNTPEEWSNFHKINEDNMKTAYNKKEGVYIKDGMMYIAGTRGFNDVMDWVKIPLGMVSFFSLFSISCLILFNSSTSLFFLPPLHV